MVWSDPILLGCLLTVFLPLTAFGLIMIFTRDNPKLSLAISLIANVNDPEKMQPILLEEVLRQAEKGSQKLERLLLVMLKNWPDE